MTVELSSKREEENMKEKLTEIIGSFRTTPAIRRELDEYREACEAAGFRGISMAAVINRLLAEGLARVAQKGDDCQAR